MPHRMRSSKRSLSALNFKAPELITKAVRRRFVILSVNRHHPLLWCGHRYRLVNQS